MKDDCFLISGVIQIRTCLEEVTGPFNNGLHGLLVLKCDCAENYDSSCVCVLCGSICVAKTPGFGSAWTLGLTFTLVHV